MEYTEAEKDAQRALGQQMLNALEAAASGGAPLFTILPAVQHVSLTSYSNQGFLKASIKVCR